MELLSNERMTWMSRSREFWTVFRSDSSKQNQKKRTENWNKRTTSLKCSNLSDFQIFYRLCGLVATGILTVTLRPNTLALTSSGSFVVEILYSRRRRLISGGASLFFIRSWTRQGTPMGVPRPSNPPFTCSRIQEFRKVSRRIRWIMKLASWFLDYTKLKLRKLHASAATAFDARFKARSESFAHSKGGGPSIYRYRWVNR